MLERRTETKSSESVILYFKYLVYLVVYQPFKPETNRIFHSFSISHLVRRTLIQPQNSHLFEWVPGWCAFGVWMLDVSVRASFPIHQSVIRNDSMRLSFNNKSKENQKLAITQILVTFIVFHIIKFYSWLFSELRITNLSKLHWSAKCTSDLFALWTGFHWPFRFQLNGYEHCNFEIYTFTPNDNGQHSSNGQILDPFQHSNSFYYDYISATEKEGRSEMEKHEINGTRFVRTSIHKSLMVLNLLKIPCITCMAMHFAFVFYVVKMTFMRWWSTNLCRLYVMNWRPISMRKWTDNPAISHWP